MSVSLRSRREYFDAPKPFDESTRGIEPRAIDGFVRTEDGQYHYAFYSLRNAERAATSPRPRAPVRPGTVQAPSPMGFGSAREAGLRATGSPHGGAYLRGGRGSGARSARGGGAAGGARVSDAGTSQAGGSLSELPPPPVAMMPAAPGDGDAPSGPGGEGKQAGAAKLRRGAHQTRFKQAEPGRRGGGGSARQGVPAKLASPSAGGPGSSGWLGRMKRVYRVDGHPTARPPSSARRSQRPQSARDARRRGSATAPAGGAPEGVEPHAGGAARPRTARADGADSRSLRRRLPGAARQFLPPPSRRHQPKGGAVLTGRQFRSPRAPAPIIRLVGPGSSDATPPQPVYANQGGVLTPAASPITHPRSVHGRGDPTARRSPPQLAASVQGTAALCSGREGAIIAIATPSRGGGGGGAFRPMAPSGGARRPRAGQRPVRASPVQPAASVQRSPAPRGPPRDQSPSFVLEHLREVSRGAPRPDPGSEVTALLSPTRGEGASRTRRAAARDRARREAGWDSRHAVVPGTRDNAQLHSGAREYFDRPRELESDGSSRLRAAGPL